MKILQPILVLQTILMVFNYGFTPSQYHTKISFLWYTHRLSACFPILSSSSQIQSVPYKYHCNFVVFPQLNTGHSLTEPLSLRAKEPGCKPGEAHNIDDLRIFPYLLCLVIFSSYIPVVLIMFPYRYNHHIVTMYPRL